MKKNNLSKSNRLFKSFLFSYFLVAGIILLILGVALYYSYVRFSEDIVKYQARDLSEMRHESDQKLQNIEDVAAMLSEEPDIIRGGYYTDNSSGDRMLFSELKTYVTGYNDLLSLEGSVFLYYNHSKTVLAPPYRYNSANLGAFSSFYMNLSDKEFLRFMDNPEGYYILHANTQNPQLFLLTQIVDKNTVSRLGKVIIRISLPALIRELLHDDSPSDLLFYITHKDDSVCVTADEEGTFQFSQTGLDVINDLSQGTVSIENKNYYLIDTLSDHVGWHYKIAVPHTVFTRQARFYSILFGIAILTALLISLLLAWRMAWKFYTPAGRLLNALNISHEASYDKALSTAEAAVAEYREQLNSQDRELKQYESHKNESTFMALLDGRLTESESRKITEEYLSEADPSKPFRLLLIGLFHIQQSVFSMNNEIDYSLMHFVLKNVFSEVLYQDSFLHRPLAFSESSVCVCLIQDMTDSDLVEKIFTVRTFLEEQAGLESVFCISETSDDPGSIPEYYLQVTDLLSFHRFWGRSQQNIIFYSDLDDELSPASETDAERKIINLISVGNMEEAREDLVQVLDQGFPRGLSFPWVKIQISALISHIAGHMLAQNGSSFETNETVQELLPVIPRCETFEELKHTVLLLFDRLSAEQNTQGNDESPAWIRKAKEYIEENYSDSSLNISTLAFRFGLTPAHFSRSYKKYTNTSILDYINLIRVEHAKQLLDEGMTVHDAALAAGYTEARALIRYFKRYEGITPGQYQNQQ